MKDVAAMHLERRGFSQQGRSWTCRVCKSRASYARGRRPAFSATQQSKQSVMHPAWALAWADAPPWDPPLSPLCLLRLIWPPQRR